jgi:hypothetical protein
MMESLESETSPRSDSRISEIAHQLEKSIEALYPQEGNGKAYMSKARSLIFNLKRNQKLREYVVSGQIEPGSLVHFSPEELATEEVQLQRAAQLRTAIYEHRADIIREVLPHCPAFIKDEDVNSERGAGESKAEVY